MLGALQAVRVTECSGLTDEGVGWLCESAAESLRSVSLGGNGA